MMISIRGHEFDFDLMDLDLMARYKAADDALSAAIDPKAIALDPSLERLLAVYDALVAFFDTVLGEGSLAVILGDKRNPIEALDAYYDLRDAALAGTQARAAAVAARAQIPDKYNPEKIRM